MADIPRSNDIIRFEDMGKTVIEGDPTLPVSEKFIDLARRLLEDTDTSRELLEDYDGCDQ